MMAETAVPPVLFSHFAKLRFSADTMKRKHENIVITPTFMLFLHHISTFSCCTKPKM